MRTLNTEPHTHMLHNCTCSMASARCLLSFCSLLRSFSMSHCKSSTVVSISDTLVSELVTLSTNSLYCKQVQRRDNSCVIQYPCTQWLHTFLHLTLSLLPTHEHKSSSCTPTSSNAAKNIIPPWTSCGVCPAGEWPGLGVECCPPAECGSGWWCQTDYHPHMLPTKIRSCQIKVEIKTFPKALLMFTCNNKLMMQRLPRKSGK